MSDKNKFDAGADDRTPSIPQYFAWINSINDGSTESQTIVNLDFFAWLKKEYGMEIKIYAWDAGNYDGAGNGYGDEDSERFHEHYPRGYAPVVERAAELGIRLGLWCGPDGYGDTPEEEKKRYDFIVKLCRDYHFALFKIDAVCGKLRPEKAAIYAKTLRDCRKYSPDLIVLNHRLSLYEAEKYATTFLWQGAETYVDTFSWNKGTGMHHRCFIFNRGIPENLERLAEDHGVCISSAIAFFEDDLIYQAFNRCMILAPEMYGNPWLMRDDEYPKLARIYNLHKHCAPILVDGMVLPESYGCNAVSRGTATHRFLATGNDAWTARTVTITLGKECGVETDGKVLLIQRHPTEKLIGIYDVNERVDVTLLPFRAHLFEIAVPEEAYPVLKDCEYEMIHEDADGVPIDVNYLDANGGTVYLLRNGTCREFGTAPSVRIDNQVPVYLGTMCEDTEAHARSEEFFEAACFAIDNDSLEARERKRAGKTAIPQVQAARDAFFGQLAYRARGCESAYAFDGNPDTFFDGWSRFYAGSLRDMDGCMRLDLGEEYDADEIEIICFAIDEPIQEVFEQVYTEQGDYSTDLIHWTPSGKAMRTIAAESYKAPVVRLKIHFTKEVMGKLVRVTYPVGKLRYFRLPNPMDRIHSIKIRKNGVELPLHNPKLNNLQAPYGRKTIAKFQSCEVTLPKDLKEGQYISVALEGTHGKDGAYCIAECEGKLLTFPDRASSYLSNVWEHFVSVTDANATYYMPLTADLAGKKMKIYTMFCDPEKTDVRCDVYLCPKHGL